MNTPRLLAASRMSQKISTSVNTSIRMARTWARAEGSDTRESGPGADFFQPNPLSPSRPGRAVPFAAALERGGSDRAGLKEGRRAAVRALPLS